jgi:hypothetical protein
LAPLSNGIDKVLVFLVLVVSLKVAPLPSTCTVNLSSALPSFDSIKERN